MLTFLAEKQWVPVWSGLGILSLALILAGTGLHPPSTPSPASWASNPSDAFAKLTSENAIAFVVVAVVASILIVCGNVARAVTEDGRAQRTRGYAWGVFVLAIGAVISLVLHGQTTLHAAGIAYEVWAILMGLLITNVPELFKGKKGEPPTRSPVPMSPGFSLVEDRKAQSRRGEELRREPLQNRAFELPVVSATEEGRPASPTLRIKVPTTTDAEEEPTADSTSFCSVVRNGIQAVARDGDFLISCALTLLGVDLSLLWGLGWRGILVGWLTTPIVTICSYYILSRLLRVEKTFAITMAGATSICGASAATAINSALKPRNRPHTLTLVVATLTIATIPQTFGVPLLAKYGFKMPEEAAGAWIGASINATGFVVASASILNSNAALIVAQTVKIIQNVIIAPIAVGVGHFFAVKKTDEAGSSPSTLAQLWHRLPKFVLGFLLTSVVLSILRATNQQMHDDVRNMCNAGSRWFFAIGFLGIGLSTNLGELWHALGEADDDDEEEEDLASPSAMEVSPVSAAQSRTGSGKSRWWPVYSYALSQSLNLIVKLGAAWLFFGVLEG